MELYQGAINGVHDAVLNVMKHQDIGLVLDIASGKGNISYNLKKMGFDVVAADIASEEFELQDIQFYELDANKKLPFTSSSFDYVVSVETIEHLKNPWYFIGEVHRILKENGKFILTTPNVESLQGRLIFLFSGKLKWFLHEDIEKSGHIYPIFSWMIPKMIENKFKIIGLTFNDGEQMGILPRFGINFRPIRVKNRLFGEIIILEMQKLD